MVTGVQTCAPDLRKLIGDFNMPVIIKKGGIV